MAVRRLKLLRFLNYFQSFHRTSVSKAPSSLLVKKISSVTCIGLNRPNQKNSLNLSLVKELFGAISSFEKDESSNVAVLYGERGNFCFGYDQDEFKENPKLVEHIEEIGLLQKYPLKVIVAAISGHAVGPGFDLALWCDFRVVEDTAIMGGYARRYGMPTNDVIVRRMYSLLGLHKAMDLMLTGRVMNSKEALECGVATRVVACGTGLGQAVNFANSLSNMPQACLRSDRAALLSLSCKYSDETNALIMQEKYKQRNIAIKEAEEGVHVTESGDVRYKT